MTERTALLYRFDFHVGNIVSSASWFSNSADVMSTRLIRGTTSSGFRFEQCFYQNPDRISILLTNVSGDSYTAEGTRKTQLVFVWFFDSLLRHLTTNFDPAEFHFFHKLSRYGLSNWVVFQEIDSKIKKDDLYHWFFFRAAKAYLRKQIRYSLYINCEHRDHHVTE